MAGSGITVTVNVNELKTKVRDEIERMIGSVTSSTETYDRVMGAIWEGMQMSGKLPVDSGALEAGQGVHTPTKTQWRDSKGRVHNHIPYPRQGNTYVTTHGRKSTLHVDPFEIRPSEDLHYAYRKEDEILEAKDAALNDPYVLSQIADIVGDKMRKSR